MRKYWNLLWRSLVIALVYTISSTLIGGIVMRGVEGLPAPANPSLLLTTTLASGFLIGLAMGPLASLIHASRWRSVAIWATVLFLNLASVILEGYFFAPELMPLTMVPRAGVMHLLTSLVTATAIGFLFPPRQPATPRAERTSRSALSWAWRLAVSAAAYLLFYYSFGAINYVLVTGPYYETHPSLAVPPAEIVIRVEAVRAVVIILSIIPLIAALRVSKRKAVVACGSVLFVIGGLLPLLMQAGMLPPLLLVASGAEIFFQNFLTGAVAARLLGRFPAPAPQAATTTGTLKVVSPGPKAKEDREH